MTREAGTTPDSAARSWIPIIAALSDARTAEDLRTAARALDRVLMWGRHVFPSTTAPRTMWHTGQPLKRPPRSVLYGIDTWAWWHEPQ